MKHTLILATLCLGCLCLGCTSSSPSPTTAEGYTSLYNGQTLDGWIALTRDGNAVTAKRVFSPGTDGTLHVYKNYPDAYALDTDPYDTHGVIITEKQYSRYSFKFEYKWGSKRVNNFGTYQYDAGMFYHVVQNKIWPKGIEYQVRYNHLTNHNHTGDIWNLGAKFQYYAAPDGTYLPETEGGIKRVHGGGEHRALPGAPFHGLDDQWNQCEVIVMGDAYAIQKLNGVVTHMITDMNIQEGAIALQAETAEIYYRNIQIKEFDAFIPANAFLNPPTREAQTAMFAHNVFFSLKDNSNEEVKSLLTECHRYLKNHPGVAYFAVSKRSVDHQREVNDSDFDVALNIVFDSVEAQDAYQVAPDHLTFIERNKDSWKEVRVFDSVVK